MEILLADDQRYQAFVEKAVTQKSMEAASYVQAKERMELTVVGGNAIIPVAGPLTYRADFWSWLFGGTSYDALSEQVEMAESARDVSRIVMIYDTPGGEVTGIQEMADAIFNCKKPTVGVIDPECASAGLWLASQCDRLVSVRSGMVGSLGVQCVTKSYSAMLEKAGIDVKVFRAAISPSKNLGHPYEPRSEEADAELQARVDKWGDRFVSAVARGRKVSSEDVLAKFGQGKMMEAEDAISVGLIDSIGTVQSVLSERVSASPIHGKSTRRRLV